jgi:hypothetical protein
MVSKTQFPWVIIIVEILATAAFAVKGFVVATVIIGVSYFISLRLHPRMRHIGFRGCGGTGEVRGSVFTWTFHKCPHCQGGRHIRWGAGRLGASHIQAEYKRNVAARQATKQNGAWR